MGFTIAYFQLFGLPTLPNIYVSIKGGFKIEKVPLVVNQLPYRIIYTIYYHASPTCPIITQQLQILELQELPKPADLYVVIYDNIKSLLDPGYKTDAQTLQFIDDNTLLDNTQLDNTQLDNTNV